MSWLPIMSPPPFQVSRAIGRAASYHNLVLVQPISHNADRRLVGVAQLRATKQEMTSELGPLLLPHPDPDILTPPHPLNRVQHDDPDPIPLILLCPNMDQNVHSMHSPKFIG